MDVENRFLRGYELQEHIGTGGFGAVYRAYQTAVGRDVAIKVILPRYANQPEFIRRFEVEAQFVAQLEHPYIVPLYDYWRDANGAYLVMRFLRSSLRQRLLRGVLSVEEITRIIDQVASALTAAHQRNVIHRDIKPDNILLDEDENAYLADFGIAKHLSKPTEGVDQSEEDYVTGSPAYIAPEQITSSVQTPQTDLYSLGVVLYEMLTGKPPFTVDTAPQYLVKHLYENLPDPTFANPSLPAAVNDVIQRATAKRPEERYESVLVLASDLRKALITSARVISISAEKIVRPSEELLSTQVPGLPLRNPYKGLHAFQEVDATDFYGRSTLVDELMERLVESGDYSRLLVVVGPSGSGKSSVVRAGVVPALRMGKLVGSPHPYLTDMIPGAEPLAQLAVALERVATVPAVEIQTELESGAHGLIHAAAQLLPDDGQTELILVVDQFEEVFTLVRDEAERQRFIDLLIAAVSEPTARVRIILTLRADFYDRPLMYPQLAEWVRRRSAVIVPMTIRELEQAISLPAARVGAMFEEGLISRIVEEIGEQPGVLPLLQYALTELFKRSDGRVLTLEAYEESGGVLGALAQRADELYAELTHAEQETARQVFLRLITLGEGTEDIRRRVLITELLALDDPKRVQSVVDRFGGARLLTLDQDPLTHTPMVDVAHEALIREWGLLHDWLDSSRDDIRLQRRLAAAAQQWLDSNRDPGFLLSKTPLEQFENWATSSQVALTSTEREFLESSVAERVRQDQAEAARRAREAEVARRARNFGRASVALAITSAIALVMIVAALLSLSTAQTQAADAEGRVDAAELTLVAVDHELTERQQLRESLRLASAANNTDDLDLTLLLGIRALTTSYSPEADQSLLQALQRYEAKRRDENLGLPDSEIPRRILDGHGDQVYTLSFSPDGTQLATGSNDRLIRIWDLRTGNILRLLEGHTDSVTGVSFTPDGQTLLSSGDSTIRLWDVASSREIKRFEGHEGTVYSAVFTPDFTRIVSAGSDQTIRIWDRETGEQLRVLRGHADSVYNVTVSPDGQQIRSASADATLRIWDFDSGQQMQMMSFPSPIYSATYSSDDRSVVVVREDGTARLLDSDTYREILVYRGHLFNVFSAGFSPDGQYLVTSSRDLSARLWNPSTGEQLRVFEGHSADVASAVFSPDGRYIATASWDGSVRVWDTDYRQLVAFACANVTRDLSVAERETYLIVDSQPTCDPQLLPLDPPAQTLPVWTPMPTATPAVPPLLASDYVYVPIGREITLDGNLDEWQNVDWITVDRGMMLSNDPEENGSFRFAVLASEGKLHVAMTMPDQNIVSGRHGLDYWREDAFQFYLNVSGDLGTRVYIPGVSEFLVNATNLNSSEPIPYSVVNYDSSRFDPQVITFTTENGWGFEATVTFTDGFRPVPGESIGFQAHMNGATQLDRDVKLIWSSLDTTDNSWSDPSLFGRIVFTPGETS
jgi:serine/threonine protein kinase/dipeptidyl aminopeptidase/acylaminoacyl peptidase